TPSMRSSPPRSWRGALGCRPPASAGVGGGRRAPHPTRAPPPPRSIRGGAAPTATPGGTFAPFALTPMAPAAAKPEMFAADEKGVVKDRANTHGWLAAGVPAVLAGLQFALDRYGTRKFPDVAKLAIKAARDGFPIKRGIAV